MYDAGLKPLRTDASRYWSPPMNPTVSAGAFSFALERAVVVMPRAVFDNLALAGRSPSLKSSLWLAGPSELQRAACRTKQASRSFPRRSRCLSPPGRGCPHPWRRCGGSFINSLSLLVEQPLRDWQRKLHLPGFYHQLWTWLWLHDPAIPGGTPFPCGLSGGLS